MKFTLSEIEEFQETWLRTYNQELSNTEAAECADQLVGLLQAFIGIDQINKQEL